MNKKVARYACYYGAGRLEALRQYDLSILQPKHYSRAEIATLRAAGVTAIAYLSVGEVAASDFQAAWSLHDPLTGEPAHNSVWRTHYVDCRSPAWQTEILERRIPALCEQGFEGLLLDTLDVQESFAHTRPGVIALLQQIRSCFPTLQLIPNRGFSIIPHIAPLIDALLFEAFSTYYAHGSYGAWDGSARLWTENKAREMRGWLGDKPILALDYAAPEDRALRALAQERAAQQGWLSFVSTYALDWLPE